MSILHAARANAYRAAKEALAKSLKVIPDGYEIHKVLARTAYPRNGNGGNPTKYYRWEVYHNGLLIGQGDQRRDAKIVIIDHLAEGA